MRHDPRGHSEQVPTQPFSLSLRSDPSATFSPPYGLWLTTSAAFQPSQPGNEGQGMMLQEEHISPTYLPQHIFPRVPRRHSRARAHLERTSQVFLSHVC